MLEYRANLLINASLGDIDRQLKDYEEEYIEKTKDMRQEVINKVYSMMRYIN